MKPTAASAKKVLGTSGTESQGSSGAPAARFFLSHSFLFSASFFFRFVVVLPLIHQTINLIISFPLTAKTPRAWIELFSVVGKEALTRLSTWSNHSLFLWTLELIIVSSRKGSFNKSTTSRITNVGPKPSRRWWSSEQPGHQKKIVNGPTGDQTAREFWSQGPEPTKSDGRVRLQNQHFSHNSPCSHHHYHLYRCHQIFSNHPDFYLMLSSKSPSSQEKEI